MADILHFPTSHRRSAIVEKYTGGCMQSLFDAVNNLPESGLSAPALASTHGESSGADPQAERATDVEPVENSQAASTSYAMTSALLRCEVMRSEGWDVTHEHAIQCNALTDRVCVHCGPICSECAAEYKCAGNGNGEHEYA